VGEDLRTAACGVLGEPAAEVSGCADIVLGMGEGFGEMEEVEKVHGHFGLFGR